jgi:hypothetical protein
MSFRGNAPAGFTPRILNLFKTCYLAGLLAMYWYDVIPGVLAFESRRNENHQMMNRTATIMKRIFDAKGLKESDLPEWGFYLNRLDAYNEAVKNAPIDKPELSSRAGRRVNTTVAIKQQLKLDSNVDYNFGVYQPSETFLQNDQRDETASGLIELITQYQSKLVNQMGTSTPNKSRPSSPSSSSPPSAATPTRAIPDGLVETTTTTTTTTTTQLTTMPAQSFLATMLAGRASGDPAVDSDGEDEFEVEVPTRNLLNLMTEVSQNA